MIQVVARATARQMVRSRSFVGLLLIYVVALLLSRFVGWVSGTDGNVVTADVVFSLQSVIGVLVAVATGTALIHAEVQQRTLYTILSRPLGRWEFIVGKFTGLSLGLCAGQLTMLVLGILYLWLTGFPCSGAQLWFFLLSGLLIMVEVVIMAGVSLMFTVMSSPLLAAVLSLAMYFMGHAVATLPQLMNHLEGWQQWVASIFASLVPNLGYFTYRNQAVHGYPPDYGDLGMSLLYAVLWITLLLTLTIIIFRRRQL